MRFLAARIPLELDVYTITPTHNFSGPNRHFLAAFRELNRLRTLRLAHYSHFQLMETDTYPLVPGWAVRLAGIAVHQQARAGNGTDGGGGRALAGRGAANERTRPWVRGGLSICLSAADAGLIPEHINGNALYTLSPSTFHEHLQAELRARMHTWAFDVMIGYWLRSAHPGKLAPSEHVISISSFQRSSSCCELVGEIVRAAAEDCAAASTDRAGGAVAGDGAGGSGRQGGAFHACAVRIPAHPQALLLHTGNIEKMPDATVHPAMRRLGASLQDIFVARGSTPCAALLTGEHSALPHELRGRYASVAPWRAPLKAMSGACAAPRGTPTAMWWAPQMRPTNDWRAAAWTAREGPDAAGWAPLGCAALEATSRLGDAAGQLSHAASVHARCVERHRLDDLLDLESGASSGDGDGLAGDGLGGSALRVGIQEGAAGGDSSAVLVVALQAPDVMVWDAFLSHRFPKLADVIRHADPGIFRADILDGSDRAQVEAAAEAAISALEAEARLEAKQEEDGRLPPSQLAERVAWVAALGRNPVVCALSGLAVSRGAARVVPNATRPSLLLGGASDAAASVGDAATTCDSASTNALRNAIVVLRERALVLPLGDDVASSLNTVSTYFGGSVTPPVRSLGVRARLLLANRTRSALGVSVSPPEWLKTAVLGADQSAGGPLGAATRVPGAASGVFGAAKGSMVLDHALYKEVLRLAAEQRRSIVWSEPVEGDMCAVADAAAAAREAPRPEPLELGEKLSFDFEGDGSRVFEVVLSPPHTRSLVLLLKARNAVGASDISINILVSHVTAAPSFSDHEFRWLRRRRGPVPVLSVAHTRAAVHPRPTQWPRLSRRALTRSLSLSRPSRQICLRVVTTPSRLEGPLHSQIGKAACLLHRSRAARW